MSSQHVSVLFKLRCPIGVAEGLHCCVSSPFFGRRAHPGVPTCDRGIFIRLQFIRPGIEGCVHAGHEQPTDVFGFLSKAWLWKGAQMGIDFLCPYKHQESLASRTFSQQHWLIVGRIGESFPNRNRFASTTRNPCLRNMFGHVKFRSRKAMENLCPEKFSCLAEEFSRLGLASSRAWASLTSNMPEISVHIIYIYIYIY